MTDRVARVIYAGSVLFALLLCGGCVIGSLLALALGDSLHGPLIATLASFGLLVFIIVHPAAMDPEHLATIRLSRS
jgi:hypothetical protein